MKTSRKILIIALIALFAGAALAFAHGGRGYDNGYADCPGYGMGPGAMGGPGYGMGPGAMHGPGGGRMNGRGDWGYGADLSQEQRDQLQSSRQEFFKQTETLRNQIDEKRLALRNEMNNQNPDAGKVGQLQKELSKLESEFDQKAVQHQLQVRKIVPDHFRGNGYGRGGYGPGDGCWRR